MATEIATLRAALRANPEGHDRLRELAESGAIQPLNDDDLHEAMTIVAASEHFGIFGAQEAQCACGAVVWLSPSTQAMIKARDAVPQPRRVCVFCFAREIKEANAQTRTN